MLSATSSTTVDSPLNNRPVKEQLFLADPSCQTIQVLQGGALLAAVEIGSEQDPLVRITQDLRRFQQTHCAANWWCLCARFADRRVESDVSAMGVAKALVVSDRWGQAMAALRKQVVRHSSWAASLDGLLRAESTNTSQTTEGTQKRDWRNAQKCFTHSPLGSCGIDKRNEWYVLVC